MAKNTGAAIDPGKESFAAIEILKANAAQVAIERVVVEHALSLVRIAVERVHEPLQAQSPRLRPRQWSTRNGAVSTTGDVVPLRLVLAVGVDIPVRNGELILLTATRVSSASKTALGAQRTARHFEPSRQAIRIGRAYRGQ